MSCKGGRRKDLGIRPPPLSGTCALPILAPYFLPVPSRLSGKGPFLFADYRKKEFLAFYRNK
nr:hypothetical protein [Bacillaceae bacterium]